MADERGIILPAGVRRADPPPPQESEGRVVIDNRTGLPDDVVAEAVEAHFVEHASMLGANLGNTFQMYANDGANFMTRARFQVPTNTFDEIKLARELAEKDDDVRATIGSMIAIAFGEGMENFHDDEQTVALFNEVAKNANLDVALKRIYREYLIASQVTTVDLFTRENFDYTPVGTKRSLQRSIVAPLCGVLQSEYVRVLDNDTFGVGTLGYIPPNEKLRRWLEEYFNPTTTPGRKAELGRLDRVSAAMFTAQIPIPLDNNWDSIGSWRGEGSSFIYVLNPRMVKRLKMASDGDYPRPMLTANFALLEAKRLLNIMDYALLQGGANFIVVAKQGSDQKPALQQEIDALEQTVRRASRTGVIVGDHRLSFDIITPRLEELLNPEKRRLIGRKLAQLLLRVSDVFESGDVQAVAAIVEVIQRVIGSDRRDIKRHVEATTYYETARRNKAIFTGGAPKLWFPKIILQGSQYFSDLVLKLRDRGDIPRKWAVEAGGFDYEAALAERRIELARGDDEILTPGAVPFTNPGAGPQDNNTGRPPGTSPDNGRPGARQGPGQDPAAPKRTIRRTPGETVRAWWDDELETTVRVGDRTYALLEEYPDRTIGRVTTAERTLVESREPTVEGPLSVVPVNIDEEFGELKAVRLAPGMSIIIGHRTRDEAIMARALVFREPEFSTLDAEETAMRWGWRIGDWSQTAEPEEETAALDPPSLPAGDPNERQEIHINVHTGAAPTRRKLIFDGNGRVVGSEEVADQHEPDHRPSAGPRGGLRSPSNRGHESAYRYGGAMPEEATVETLIPLPAWENTWDQGRLDACVGYACSMALSMVNERQAKDENTPPFTRRYDPVWLWNEARVTDEFPDNNDLAVNDGTSLRAGFDVLRDEGPRRWDGAQLLQPDPAEGIQRNEWLKTVEEVRHAISQGCPVVVGSPFFKKWLNASEYEGEPWVGRGDQSSWGPEVFLHAFVVYAASDKRGGVRFKSSWSDYPEPWMPYETLDAMFKDGAEASCIVDR